MNKVWIALGLVFAAAPASYAIVAAPFGGVTPVDTTFTFVGQINGASAVAVGPRTVLTARHVGPGNFTLGSSTYTELNHVFAPTVANPDGSGNTNIDLVLVNLTSDLPGWYNIANSVSNNSTVTMVGYGGTGVVNATNTGYTITTGAGNIRRAGNNTLDGTEFVNGEGSSLLSFLDAAPEAAVVGGDSGGGWFVGNQLVGISLFYFNLSDDGVNRIYDDYGFANNNTAGYNIGGNSGAPGTAYFGSGALDLTSQSMRDFVAANAVPEPGSMIAIGTGIAALMARRRKKV